MREQILALVDRLDTEDFEEERALLLAVEKRLAEATDMLCEGMNKRMGVVAMLAWIERIEAFLSATPSPPAEPAPSLVEQIEAIARWNPCVCDANDEDGPVYQGFLTDPEGVWVRWEDVDALLRAAREAGGR